MTDTHCLVTACGKPLTPTQIRKGIKTCSRSCGAKRFRPWAPQVCKMCPRRLSKDQVRRKQVTCSRACGGAYLRRRPKYLRIAAARKGNQARQQKFTKRIIAEVVRDCRPLLAHIGDRELMESFAKVVIKHRRRGYERGWSAHYQRIKRSA